MADEDTERRRTLILRKIVHQWNEEKAENAAVCVAICSGCIGMRLADWQCFFFFFSGTKFTHAQYIDIMYALDSTGQKFDV